jgi:hypothetical protein
MRLAKVYTSKEATARKPLPTMSGLARRIDVTGLMVLVGGVQAMLGLRNVIPGRTPSAAVVPSAQTATRHVPPE